MPAYASSKAGLIMLTQQVALDYGPYKVRSNVVCPGGARTAMIEHSPGALKETLTTDPEGVFKVVSSGLPLAGLRLLKRSRASAVSRQLMAPVSLDKR
jgi:NAD(P)-dependent dehydrogenase (short-subunit alcohol dehydrogenase family)